MAREAQVIETFVSLADTLVDDFDVIDFLHSLAERAVELLDVTAAGIMLADGEATLRHAACSSEQMRLVELFELQFREGPCFDAYREVAPVRCGSPDDAHANSGHSSQRKHNGPASSRCRPCPCNCVATPSER